MRNFNQKEGSILKNSRYPFAQPTTQPGLFGIRLRYYFAGALALLVLGLVLVKWIGFVQKNDARAQTAGDLSIFMNIEAQAVVVVLHDQPWQNTPAEVRRRNSEVAGRLMKYGFKPVIRHSPDGIDAITQKNCFIIRPNMLDESSALVLDVTVDHQIRGSERVGSYAEAIDQLLRRLTVHKRTSKMT